MQETIVSMKNITKEFPGVKALDNVSFELRKGEVMALLGENGAGKSTLMKVLCGIYQRDSGEIEIFGKNITELNPKIAKESGIAIIHQELNLCPHLSVSANLFLGREPVKFGRIDTAKMNVDATEMLGKLGCSISPTELVGNLSVSKQQMIEIAKALSMNARILIMDEPTSSLSSREINELFDIIRQLRQEGCGIVYISHRLEELKSIVDRVTIMRDGKYITSGNFKDFTMDFIISNMVGREIKEQFPRVECTSGEEIFSVKHLNAGKMVKDVTFSLHRGEILGIAGLMGAGRTELTRAIFGVDKKDSGEIYIEGKLINVNSSIDAISNGIVLVPEDRKKDGLCTKLSVKNNISLPNLDLLSNRNGIIHKSKEGKMTDDAIRNLSIKLSSPNTPAINLSGGNQQKVVVGKWLSRESKVVILDEPTRGIDIAAKIEIYNIMNELKKQGIGVVFVSSEMPEILGVSDRILVMCDGRITGQLNREEASQEKILKLATQFEEKE